MPWRNETNPKKCEIYSRIHELLTEAERSGKSGNIVFERLAYWAGGGFGTLEAGRTEKIDLTKVGVKS